MTSRIWADPPRLRLFAGGANEDLAHLSGHVEDTWATAAATGSDLDLQPVVALLGEVRSLVAQLVQATTTLEFVADEAARLDRRFSDAHLLNQVRWLDGRWSTAHHAVAVLQALDDPQAVALLWDALSPDVRQGLVNRHPAVVGLADGIDPQARDRANRARITTRLAALASEADRVRQRAQEVADRTGPTDHVEELVMDIRARRIGDRIATLESLLAADQVLAWDPTGDGRAVIAWGDVATADVVATFVPGTTSSLDNLDPVIADGRRLHDATRSVASRDDTTRATSTATVAWLGYDAPSGPLGLVEATSTASARRGARRLADWTAGLRAVNDRARHVAVGHSYGALVTTRAAQASEHGLAVHRLVLLGAPGTGTPADAVGDLDLPDDADVLVATTHLDPVPHLPGLGRNPERLDGAVRIPTGPGNIGHAGYLIPHTLGAENVARAVLGVELLDVRVPWPPHPRFATRQDPVPGADGGPGG